MGPRPGKCSTKQSVLPYVSFFYLPSRNERRSASQNHRQHQTLPTVTKLRSSVTAIMPRVEPILLPSFSGVSISHSFFPLLFAFPHYCDMHEFLLFGQVANNDHHKLLQQLAGVTRMQPQHVVERHLIFKARPPVGLGNISSGGGSQGVLPQEVQKVKQWLASSIFYLQLVYTARSGRAQVSSSQVVQPDLANGDTSQGRSTVQTEPSNSVQQEDGVWTIEFRDIPEPGKQVVTTRLLSRTITQGGDLIQFVKDLGHGYENGCFVYQEMKFVNGI